MQHSIHDVEFKTHTNEEMSIRETVLLLDNSSESNHFLLDTTNYVSHFQF